jgi:phosphoadenosine phosphosulfate reductase
MRRVLQFSGGKDSLACLTLLRAELDDVMVAWVNTGAAFPETVALMEEVRSSVPHFMEIVSAQTIDSRGYPADLPPVQASQVGRLMTDKPGTRFQSRIECCAASLWMPMGHFIRELQPEVVIRGQKLADRRKSPIRSGQVVEGIRYEFPIETWTDEDVFAYLAANKVRLPKNYRLMMTGLDCWNCTAYLDENPGRMAYLREHHPERFRHVRAVLADLKHEVDLEVAPLNNALKE